jgi:hypothetical protein
MAKAAACITTCSVAGPGLVSVSMNVSTDTGVAFSTDVQVDFTVSSALILLNIKNRLIVVLSGFGITLAATDILVFGGPS